MNELKKSNETTTAAVHGEITRAMAKAGGIVENIGQDVNNRLMQSVKDFNNELRETGDALNNFFSKHFYFYLIMGAINVFTFIGVMFLFYKFLVK